MIYRQTHQPAHPEELALRQLADLGRRTRQTAAERAAKQARREREKELKAERAAAAARDKERRERIARSVTGWARLRSVFWALYISGSIAASFAPLIIFLSAALWPICAIAALPIVALVIGRLVTAPAIAREKAWLDSRPLPVRGYWEELGRDSGPRCAALRFRDKPPSDELVTNLLVALEIERWTVTDSDDDRVIRLTIPEYSMSPRAYRAAARSIIDELATRLHAVYPLESLRLHSA